jgi:hypothetical protein
MKEEKSYNPHHENSTIEFRNTINNLVTIGENRIRQDYASNSTFLYHQRSSLSATNAIIEIAKGVLGIELSNAEDRMIQLTSSDLLKGLVGIHISNNGYENQRIPLNIPLGEGRPLLRVFIINTISDVARLDINNIHIPETVTINQIGGWVNSLEKIASDPFASKIANQL